MDIAYLHIVLNHLPIIGVPFGLGLLVLGIFTRNDSIKRAALLSFVILGILTIPVYLTGQGGEDFVEDLAGISESSIEDHERMATFALISVGVLALFSLFAFLKNQGLSLFKRSGSDESRMLDGDVSAGSVSAIPGWAVLTALILALITSGILGYTGKLGGKIRHTEFYGGAQAEEEDEEKGRNRRGRDERRTNGENPTANLNSANQVVPPAEEAEENEKAEETEKKDERGRNRRGRRDR